MNILHLILDRALSVLLVAFTYLIPLLSSIRAVHHKDTQAYQQWLTYYLLIFLFHPICLLLRIHKLFRLIIVLYLSLPKFQGALFIYQEVIHVLMDRYSVEEKVDEHIGKVKMSIKARLWNVAKDIGWSALTQVGEIVSLIRGDYQDSPNVTTTEAVPATGRNRKKEDMVGVIKRNPSHSVLESWSSFSSSKDEGADGRRDPSEMYALDMDGSYVQDFLAMLQEGLYVFAAQHLSQNHDRKSFRLRIFFYQEDNKCDQDDPQRISSPCFVLQSVGRDQEEGEGRDESAVEIIPIDDIQEIRRSSDGNGIEFLSFHSSSCSKTLVLNGDSACTKSEPTSLPDLAVNNNSQDSSTAKTIATTKNAAESHLGLKDEKILAEIVLSSHEDRETLFWGLKACFSWFQKEKRERITVDGDDDDDDENDDAHSSSSIFRPCTNLCQEDRADENQSTEGGKEMCDEQVKNTIESDDSSTPISVASSLDEVHEQQRKTEVELRINE